MRSPNVDFSILERQLHDIGTQIKALQTSYRCDGMAAELTRTIQDAAPKRAIEGIEEQLRRLTSQLETARPAAPVDQVVDSLRHDLADIARRNTFCSRGCVRPTRPSCAVIFGLYQSCQQPRPDLAIGVFRTPLGRASSRSDSLAACSGMRPPLR